MPECYILSCSEPGTHEVTLRDARLTYLGSKADVSRPYCPDHAESYSGDGRCVVRRSTEAEGHD